MYFREHSLPARFFAARYSILRTLRRLDRNAALVHTQPPRSGAAASTASLHRTSKSSRTSPLIFFSLFRQPHTHVLNGCNLQASSPLPLLKTQKPSPWPRSEFPSRSLLLRRPRLAVSACLASGSKCLWQGRDSGVHGAGRRASMGFELVADCGILVFCDP